MLVYKLDRFSRNKYEMAVHKKTLRDSGIKLVSAMENIPDTPEGIIGELLPEGMSEKFSENIMIEQSKERTKLPKEDIIKYIISALRKFPRQLLDLLIKEIRLYNDKIEIDFHFVDKKSPDDDNRWGFCFYKCKKSGKYYTVEKSYFGAIEKTFELEIILYV